MGRNKSKVKTQESKGKSERTKLETGNSKMEIRKWKLEKGNSTSAASFEWGEGQIKGQNARPEK
jgi:hypothetical protein